MPKRFYRNHQEKERKKSKEKIQGHDVNAYQHGQFRLLRSGRLTCLKKAWEIMKNVGWELDMIFWNPLLQFTTKPTTCPHPNFSAISLFQDQSWDHWICRAHNGCGRPEKPLKDPTFPTLGHLIETAESNSSSQPSISISKQKIVQLGSSNGNNLH